tara:strand:- start:2056 stop:3348 length:1293 start_codon:yes stop_codon:yes gene_type:complete
MRNSQHSQPIESLSYDSIVSYLAQLKPWIVCLSAALFFFYDFMLMNMFNSINSEISLTFSLNATEVSLLSGLYPSATVLLLMVCGLLLDRYSTRKIILTAMFLFIMSTIGFACSQFLVQAAICRFIAGGTAAFCFLSCVMLASRWFKDNRLALITGLIVTMGMTGGTISQAPLKIIVELFGWRVSLLMISLVGFLLWLIMFFTIADRPGQRHWVQPEEAPTKSVKDSLWIAVSNPQNWILGSYTSLMNVLICVFGGLWGQAYISSVYNLDGFSSSKVTTMIFLGTTLGSPICGWISDTLRRRQLPMMLGSLISFLLVLTLMNLDHPSFEFLEFLFFALGFTTSSQVISYPAIFESNDSSVTGICESFSATLIMSGYAVFPIIYGFLLDFNDHVTYVAQDHKLAFYILPLSLIISFILSLFVKETNCQSHK